MPTKLACIQASGCFLNWWLMRQLSWMWWGSKKSKPRASKTVSSTPPWLCTSSAPRSYSEFLPWLPWTMEYKLWTEIISFSSSWFWSRHFTAVMETLTKRTIMEKRHGPENLCPVSLSLFFFNSLHPKSQMITYFSVSINLSFIQYQ